MRLNQGFRKSVSYTHLDVYKRQLFGCSSAPIFNNPNQCIGKIGISRTINLAQFKGQNFGSFGFQKLDLKPYEVVLTFDDGPTDDVTPVSYTHLDVYKRQA